MPDVALGSYCVGAVEGVGWWNSKAGGNGYLGPVVVVEVCLDLAIY